MGGQVVFLDDVLEEISVAEFHIRNAICRKAFNAGPLLGALIDQQAKERANKK